MNKLKIEKKVPIPTRTRRGIYADTFKVMNVGDSFLVDKAKRFSVMASAYRFYGAPAHVVSRKEGNKVRVWRIK